MTLDVEIPLDHLAEKFMEVATADYSPIETGPEVIDAFRQLGARSLFLELAQTYGQPCGPDGPHGFKSGTFGIDPHEYDPHDTEIIVSSHAVNLRSTPEGQSCSYGLTFGNNDGVLVSADYTKYSPGFVNLSPGSFEDVSERDELAPLAILNLQLLSTEAAVTIQGIAAQKHIADKALEHLRPILEAIPNIEAIRR